MELNGIVTSLLMQTMSGTNALYRLAVRFMHGYLSVCFVDLKAAFDSMWRDGLSLISVAHFLRFHETYIPVSLCC